MILEYYENKVTEEIENQYYEDDAYQFVRGPSVFTYFWQDVTKMKNAINEAIEKLNLMLSDIESIEDDNDIDSAIKEIWNEEEQHDLSWEEYQNSNDYAEQSEFISETWYQDFIDNYRYELEYFRSYRDLNHLSNKINELIDNIHEMNKKIPIIIENCKKQVIADIFEDAYIYS